MSSKEYYQKIRQVLALKARPAVKVVLIYILDRQGRNGTAWPSLDSMIRDCRLSRDAVVNSIKKAETKGFLEIKRPDKPARNRSSHYRVILPDFEPKEPVRKTDRLNRKNQSGKTKEPVRKTDRNQSVKQTGNQSVKQTVTTHSNDSLNESLTTNSKNAKTIFPENLDTPEFLKVWNEWIQYRTEIRKKLTPSTVHRQLTTLSKLSVTEAIQTIEKSIENGWQGLFPDKKHIPAQDKTPETKPLCCVCGRPSQVIMAGMNFCSDKCRQEKLGW
jgi:hypothetical protein